MDKDWRPVPGHEGYYWVNKSGQVKNADGKMIAHIDCGNGVVKVKLQSCGQRDEWYISTLLAEVFPERRDK